MMLARIYHPYWRWECYKAGFYASSCKLDEEAAINAYATFLADLDTFGSAMDRVFAEWPNSCEQFLTNPNINRIAWLGQASMCIANNVPSKYKSGYKLLNLDQQKAADALAAKRLEEWCYKRKSSSI